MDCSVAPTSGVGEGEASGVEEGEASGVEEGEASDPTCLTLTSSF